MYTCWVVGDGALTARCCDILLRNDRALRGIVTDSEFVAEWARERDVATVSRADMMAELGRERFDYLLSIVNLRILREDALALPEKHAINFHDGPLPEYAGVHCTSWALLHGATEYGVTWHRISGGVDEGPILEQERFEVSGRETAYTLNAKCYDAAARSFERLDAALASGEAVERAQDLSKRNYFGMFQHPDSVLDFSQSASKLEALVRATELGGHPNLLGRAKVRLGDDYFVCEAAEAVPSVRAWNPGEVLEADEDGVLVAAGEGALRITSLSTLDGSPAPQLRIGQVFDSLDAEAAR